eukprot:m.65141 g.65141  ORF g.65141 m.65141 type:complete len:57 (+) comp11515_c2_seq1:716-886(+)
MRNKFEGNDVEEEETNLAHNSSNSRICLCVCVYVSVCVYASVSVRELLVTRMPRLI